MKFHWSIAVLSALALGCPAMATAQTLGELARQEAARRQTVARGKVITNGDLKSEPQSTAPAAPVPGTTLAPPPTLEKALAPATGDQKSTSASDATKAPGDKAQAGEKKDEKYWRQRVTTVRDNLARSQTFQVALEARISALSADFVNRDDPAQRAQVASDRLKATTELERVKKEIVQYQAELKTIADEARQAGVPAGWVR